MGIRLSRRFTKFVCLIFFLVISFKVYRSVNKTHEIFKKEKEMKSQSLMLPFNIRRDGFFSIKPIYAPPMENKDIVINVKGKEIILEEVVNAIKKENATSLTQSAVVVTQEIEESIQVTENEEDKNIKIENIIKDAEVKKTAQAKSSTVEKEVDIKEKSVNKTYYIQLGIYKDKKNAEKIASKASGYSVSISEDSAKGQKIYRASVEGFDSRESAMAAADVLRKVTEGELPIVRVRY